jgi:hypothetical protein
VRKAVLIIAILGRSAPETSQLEKVLFASWVLILLARLSVRFCRLGRGPWRSLGLVGGRITHPQLHDFSVACLSAAWPILRMPDRAGDRGYWLNVHCGRELRFARVPFITSPTRTLCSTTSSSERGGNGEVCWSIVPALGNETPAPFPCKVYIYDLELQAGSKLTVIFESVPGQ